VAGLGTVGYISTIVIPDPLSLTNYLTTPEIRFNGTVGNNITLTPRPVGGKVIIQSPLDMCNNNIINAANLVQTSQLTSTVIGLGTVGYISTAGGGTIIDPLYLGIGLYTPNIYNNSSYGNNLTVQATDYLNLKANCNVNMNVELNMCNNNIRLVPTITSGSDLTLTPGPGCNVVVGSLSNGGGSGSGLELYGGPNAAYTVRIHSHLDMCNYEIRNLSQIQGQSNSGGGLGSSTVDFDYAHQGDIYMRGAYDDSIIIGNGYGGNGISLTLSNGADKNKITINGSAMANVHGIATIARDHTSITITDSNITGLSVIIVTPYININQNFWVTQTAYTSFDINILISQDSSVDFSYFIPRY
jgi:hypothetical protein